MSTVTGPQSNGRTASAGPALLELRGDVGFRAIAGRFRVQRLAVNDVGILQDVDAAGELQ